MILYWRFEQKTVKSDRKEIKMILQKHRLKYKKSVPAVIGFLFSPAGAVGFPVYYFHN